MEQRQDQHHAGPCPATAALLPPPLPPTAAPPPAHAGVHAALTDALRGLVSKPDLYLVKAAQASTLKQLKAARKLLRDLNAAAKHQLGEQVEQGKAALDHLQTIRQQLDETHACLRALKQQLAEERPDLHQQLLRELARSRGEDADE